MNASLRAWTALKRRCVSAAYDTTTQEVSSPDNRAAGVPGQVNRPANAETGILLASGGTRKNMSADPTNTFIDDYLPALLAQASQLISTEFHEVVRQHDLSVTEWRILSTLLGAGEISIGKLAQVTLTKQPTVTRLLDRLEALGHLRRIAHDSDRRITLVRITDSGQSLIADLAVQAKQHEEDVLKRLAPLDSEALKMTLRRLIAEYREPM